MYFEQCGNLGCEVAAISYTNFNEFLMIKKSKIMLIPLPDFINQNMSLTFEVSSKSKI